METQSLVKIRSKRISDWFRYLYGPSGEQRSGQSSLVWFCRMFTISCLTDWISLSAPGERQTDRQVRQEVWDRQSETGEEGVSHLCRSSLVPSQDCERENTAEKQSDSYCMSTWCLHLSAHSQTRCRGVAQWWCSKVTYLKCRVEFDAKLFTDIKVFLLSAIQHGNTDDLLPV